ncbi:NACHT, LRR and PYD domains-containing protein 9B-like isoform X2 [Hydra vulgaris]|uniref:NACHT, LRR and PYD domains-containing protein 9B-like isoform X2 n=1 Tax=Hydra vulgaris TaxID=6087 RepID=A0ABM4D9T2_HYDVU
MDIRVLEILVNKVSSDWQKFAFNWFVDLNSAIAIIDNINANNLNAGKNAAGKKLKMRALLTVLYEQYPEDYESMITSSLKYLKRNDVLEELEKLDKFNVSAALKDFYIQKFKEIDELQPLLKIPANANLSNNFIDMCVVDVANMQKNAGYTAERMEFLKKKINYKLISYSEIFKHEKSLLIAGIAGIGKSWFLKKCLIDWASNRIWEKVEFVFFFECRLLNLYENISNMKELLNIFYKNFTKDLDINNHNIIFVIDGLDEFKYLNELINPGSSIKFPIVNVLSEVQKYNHVVAGRVYALDQFQNISIKHYNRLTIQIMGFNENGINNYIENNVIENKKENVKTILKESKIAKAMSSVPFYLSAICKMIVELKQIKISFLTMTDLHASIFFYFYQKHVNITKEPFIKIDDLSKGHHILKVMESKQHKKYIFIICKIAYELFVKSKVVFSIEEFQKFTSGLGKVEDQFFGFIERVETNLGYQYQFVHLTIMEFCASVYAFNNFSGKEIIDNEKLASCLSMICGLTNKSQNSLVTILVNLNQNRCLNQSRCCLFKCLVNSNYFNDDKISMIHICNDMKPTIDKRMWGILINDRKCYYETFCQNYFVNHLINSGRQLSKLTVCKNNLSDEEKDLLIQCSSNVRSLIFRCPIKFEGWKRENNLEWLRIRISNYLISEIDFKECFLSWMKVCEKLEVCLHDEIEFIDNFYKWIHNLNIQWLLISYRANRFNLEEFKNFITSKILLNE